LGRFDFPTAKAIWKDSTYAGKYKELLALMLKFELCYELQDVQPQTWLAPGLLHVSKPDALADWPQLGDLVLRYEYEFMPKGLVNRLTVRMHRYVRQPALAWRNGVFFEHEGAELLVEVSSKGNEVVLRARGQMKKELLVVIAAELDALNAGYKGLEEKVKKWVPCNCHKCKTCNQPREHLNTKGCCVGNSMASPLWNATLAWLT
jgi:internalin A